ncbi:hypothetical protein OI71_19740 [Aeromonas hydrophila]|nr:hypothetical protein OI71_19740 [Aeromonas hydrophila]
MFGIKNHDSLHESTQEVINGELVIIDRRATQFLSQAKERLVSMMNDKICWHEVLTVVWVWLTTRFYWQTRLFSVRWGGRRFQ